MHIPFNPASSERRVGVCHELTPTPLASAEPFHLHAFKRTPATNQRIAANRRARHKNVSVSVHLPAPAVV